MPAISVLMSVYNGERYLAKAIDSILAQTFEDFEFIIINDGSTDGSSKILEEYTTTDNRIVLIQQENKGLVAALNTGIDIALAPLIARMDADDIALPNRLKIQKDYMDKTPDTVALGGAIELINENDKQFGHVKYPSKDQIDDYIYNRGSPLAHPAVMMRTEAVKALGGYRMAYKHAEDYDLWLRMHKVGTIDNLPQTILKYREHLQKVSTQHKHQQAIASVVARYAAKAEKDLTEKLENVTEDTLKLFKADQSRMDWEVIDIIASNLLLSPSKETIDELYAKVPQTVSKAAKPIAVRAYLKFAHASAKSKNYASCLRHIKQAFFASPKHTLSLLSEKLL